jgi:type III pantothenate kinase
MLLAIDVGNTETTIGVFRGEELVSQWRMATVASRTADEHALLLGGFLAQERLALRAGDGDAASGAVPVTGLAVASVVPRLTSVLRELAERYLRVEPVMIGPGVRTGLPILTDNPREVGADRVVNALAAHAAYGGPAVVVDFGTATTFDAVSGRGELLGSAIAPGIQVSVSALTERAAQLQRVELVRPRAVIGRNTVESLQSGVVFGFAGQVDGIVRRMTAELGGAATVVATGGLAGVVLDVCETLQHHDPWLTLRGLRIVYNRNAGGDQPARQRPARLQPARPERPRG